MDFKQIYTPGLAHCSYVIGGKNECVVVDPRRNVDQYLEISEELEKPITGILITHLHADFVAGHMELRERTGAVIYISEKANAAFEHRALGDGEEIRLDTLLFKILDTPGHTPEGSVFLVSDLERGNEPALMLSGDTMLVGDAGRPDLFPDIKEELASKLYDSMRKIKALPDRIEAYPAHGAGSLCGKALSSKLSSTIGIEKLYNPALTTEPMSVFVDSFIKDMPEVPDHFARCSERNRLGPVVTKKLPKPRAVGPKEFFELSRTSHIVVDTRDQLSFGAAHVPGAYGLSLKGNFATFSGWVLPPDKPLLLVLDTSAELDAALSGLYSVGLDRIEGYLDGGMTAYAESGFKTESYECISAAELYERLSRNELILIDTRLKSELDSGHIEGSIHSPAPDVRKRYGEWTVNKPVAFICSTGNRSMLASSLMQRLSGQKNVINVIGGITAWKNAGYPVK